MRTDLSKARLLFWTFFKIGAFTFGGVYSMIPLIQRDVAERRLWLKDGDILDIVAIAVSILIILLVARFYAAFRSSAIISGAMSGLRPAVIGMIGAAAVSVGQTVFAPDGVQALAGYPLACSLAIFVLMAFLTHRKLHPIAIILLSALLGIAAGYLRPM